MQPRTDFNSTWRDRGPRIVQGLAMLALAAGVGVWAAVLLAPQPSAPPPALASQPAPGQNISALVNWFGGGNARLRVAVVGVIASGERGAALLSVNGAPAKAYRVGQILAHGVTVAKVLPDGVSIDQDGILEDIRVPNRVLPSPGFVPIAHAPDNRYSHNKATMPAAAK
jgi:general secretion pathway protein C